MCCVAQLRPLALTLVNDMLTPFKAGCIVVNAKLTRVNYVCRVDKKIMLATDEKFLAMLAVLIESTLSDLKKLDRRKYVHVLLCVCVVMCVLLCVLLLLARVCVVVCVCAPVCVLLCVPAVGID